MRGADGISKSKALVTGGNAGIQDERAVPDTLSDLLQLNVFSTDAFIPWRSGAELHPHGGAHPPVNIYR
jgi:hypothetical protein